MNVNPADTKKDFFIYGARFQTLAAAAQQTFTINIEADSDFVLVKMAQFSEIAGAPQTDSTRVLPLVTLQMLDTGSGRNLLGIAQPIDAICGRGELPMVLPVPRLFKAKTSISLTALNTSAATTYANIWIALIGYKVFSF
jgi:hypothetical protein